MKLFSSVVNQLLHHSNQATPFISAILLAGGSSTRMGGTLSKQMALLNGIPVIVRTIMAFEQNEAIDEIIIAAKKEEMIRYKEFAKLYKFTKVKAIVSGGENRQESAFRCIHKLNPQCDFILIHDGARPLVSQKNIEDTLKAAIKYNCACAASRAKDTVKIATALDFIESTPNRERVWQALTPQVFKADIYRAAAYMAKKDNFEGTDDCSLVERLGFKIKLVDCGYQNIKITTLEDLAVAEQYSKERS
ncbi:MAG: 2-C-methyl-D-erythritol 4-phosphate cytidylyltransferase [Clostridiales bacterium]|nr:2-C-methyl-D-erythritol 4-phosphate cytidylyltransferase [Clostridiales bacterium]